MKKEDYLNQGLLLELLKEEVIPTSGCTEPGAVALAAAYAAACLVDTGSIIHIGVTVSPNIYKNGIAVGIPGTGETGLAIAAALGALKPYPEKQLGILDDVGSEELACAKELLARFMVDVEVDYAKEKLYVEVKISTDRSWCRAVIKSKHTNLVSLCRNGVYLMEDDETAASAAPSRRTVLTERMRIADLFRVVEEIPDQELVFVLDGVDMNLAAAEIGLNKNLGMGIGLFYQSSAGHGREPEDMVNYAKMLTAAAADARMSGENVRVMSSAGSGNHGITAIMPVYAVAKKIGASRERLARAVALSHLTTVYIKTFTGSLSALCGCAVAAATGAGAAVTWLMGGTQEEIEATIKNIIANLTGVICDGGKVGCALKLATAAAVAVESALLALRGIVVPDSNGIIARTVEDTVKNLGIVSEQGMLLTDKVILEVMLNKNNAACSCY